VPQRERYTAQGAGIEESNTADYSGVAVDWAVIKLMTGEKQMKTSTVELSTGKGKRYLKQEGSYINVYDASEGKKYPEDRINIPLFYEIALFASCRRSYKSVMLKFFDRLRGENIPYFFTTRESLESATQACGRPGGHIAYLLGLFCRYYDKRPRNVNVVWQRCEDCNNDRCGQQEKCGDYYGCGDGVIVPLDPSALNIETIPAIRRAIRTEIFGSCPES
jgi:hypothetical protein